MGSTPRSLVPASLHLEALQLKSSWACPVWERRSVRSSRTHPPFWFESRWRDGDARDRSLIGKGVLTTPEFGPFCREGRCSIYYPALAYRPFDVVNAIVDAGSTRPGWMPTQVQVVSKYHFLTLLLMIWHTYSCFHVKFGNSLANDLINKSRGSSHAFFCPLRYNLKCITS